MPIARFATPRNQSRARLAFGAALALFALYACGHKGRQAPPAPYVATTVATQGTIFPSSQLAGIIAPYENVAIQTTLVEPADDVYVQEGDMVRRGQVIAQLDTEDLESQLASDLANTSHTYYQGGLSISQGSDALRQAETTLRTDELNLERDEALLRQGYIARQTVDAQLETVRNDEQAASADRATVQANGSLNGSGLQASAIAQAHAEAQQVRVAITKATIYSPITGVVVNRNLNPGEYPGDRQIFTLQQIDPIFAVVQGSGVQIAHIETGAPATVDISDLGARVTGHVVGVLNQIVPGSTNFMVKIIIANPAHTIRPGMSVQASVNLPSLSGVRVPDTAFTNENHTQVMIVNQQSVVQIATVNEIGTDGTTSVVSGVAPGTRIVSNGMASVGVGERVSLR